MRVLASKFKGSLLATSVGKRSKLQGAFGSVNPLCRPKAGHEALYKRFPPGRQEVRNAAH